MNASTPPDRALCSAPAADPVRTPPVAPVAAAGAEPSVRAPRLTANRLDDLEAVVLLIDDELDYLAGASNITKGSSAHASIEAKRGKLQRSREWLTGKIAAERAQRATGDSGAVQ